jgi:hypothetical protein
MNSERQIHAHSNNSGFESVQKGASARFGSKKDLTYSAICCHSEYGAWSFYGKELYLVVYLTV